MWASCLKTEHKFLPPKISRKNEALMKEMDWSLARGCLLSLFETFYIISVYLKGEEGLPECSHSWATSACSQE